MLSGGGGESPPKGKEQLAKVALARENADSNYGIP